jgi:prevent-host-death family protein
MVGSTVIRKRGSGSIRQSAQAATASLESFFTVHHNAHICTGGSMSDATFTELRNNAKHYFDAVEAGESVRVFRNGKPIAEIVPIRTGMPSWKRMVSPLTVKGLKLSREVLGDRDDSA